MHKGVPTLTDFILADQRTHPHATGNFTMLLMQIENAAKIIASHVKASGLVDIIGKTGTKNAFGEEVQKLDEYSNNLLVEMLTKSGSVYALVSEELEKEVYSPKETSGEYIVYFDPLDGSSNIDTNCPIGTIFSIYHKAEGLLQPGKNQIAAGYVMYGSSVMFVYTCGHGVNGFTLDPAIGSFLLSHPAMAIPKSGEIYSINEAYYDRLDPEVQKYLDAQKKKDKIRSRFVGSLIADAHRTFVKGGIFLYPTDKKQPEGKLRLMLEVNPFAYLTEQAGGKVVSHGTINPLEITPKHIHQKSALVMGSTENIEEYLEFVK